jgi:putative transposase
VRRGKDWLAYVQEPQTDAELVALRRSVERGVPYGSERWQKRTIKALGLESTLRPRGRPRKRNNEA